MNKKIAIFLSMAITLLYFERPEQLCSSRSFEFTYLILFCTSAFVAYNIKDKNIKKLAYGVFGIMLVIIITFAIIFPGNRRAAIHAGFDYLSEAMCR